MAKALVTPDFDPILPLKWCFSTKIALKSLSQFVWKSGLSLDRYLLDAYFFTQPSKEKGVMDLLGARPRGELIYAGKVRKSEGGYAFSLRSLDTRYAPAIEVEGVYDPGKRAWAFSKAITSEVVAARANPAVTPRKVGLEILRVRSYQQAQSAYSGNF